MIKSIHIRNFLSHSQTELNLAPITVLVGPNGGGKSAVFQAIRQVQSVARAVHQQSDLNNLFDVDGPGSLNSFRWYGASDAEPIRIDIMSEIARDDGHRADFSYSMELSNRGIAQESLEYLNQSMSRGPYSEMNRSVLSTSSAIRHAIRNDVILFHLQPNLLKGSNSVEDVERLSSSRFEPHVGHFGKSLTTSISWMIENDDVADLDEAVSWVTSGRYSNLAVREIPGVVEPTLEWTYRSVRTEHAIPSRNTADGSAMLVGHAAVLVWAGRRSELTTILFEEPERGLTPTGQRRLAELIQRTQAKNPRVQVVLTTHSPYIADYFRQVDETVEYVLFPDHDSGATSVRELEVWLEDFHGGAYAMPGGANAIDQVRLAMEGF